MYDILIKGGKVITGAGNPWFKADVGIKDGKIAKVGTLKGAEADRVIDGEGLVMSPGFVDVHNHSDTNLMVNPKNLKDAAMVLAQSLIHLANEPDTIAERTPAEEIVRRLEESGMADTLRVQLK